MMRVIQGVGEDLARLEERIGADRTPPGVA